MKNKNASIHLLIIILFSCQGKPAKQNLEQLSLLRGGITLCGNAQFGEVNFSTSCNENVRSDFDLGISLLHSFEYEEAEKAFAKVIDKVPDCAMAYWGVAMSNFHLLWMQSGTEYLEKGEKVIEIARQLSMTERERDYIDAIGAFYDDWEKADRGVRLATFEQRMSNNYRKYKDDKEAAIFYALTLIATAKPADKTYSNQLKAGGILETVFADSRRFS